VVVDQDHLASACREVDLHCPVPIHTSRQVARLQRFNPRKMVSLVDRSAPLTYRSNIQLRCTAHRRATWRAAHSLVWGRCARLEGSHSHRLGACTAQRHNAQVPSSCHARHARPNDDSIPSMASRHGSSPISWQAGGYVSTRPPT